MQQLTTDVTRVAVSADDNNGLESVVSPHFGRCPYYILVDLEGSQVQRVEAVANPYFGRHAPGQVPTFINEQGVNVMLTGGMGMRAIGFFQQYGVQAVTGAAGTVRHALEQYLGGQLQGAEPCRDSHSHGEGGSGDEHEHDDAGRLREEVEMLERQLEEVAERLRKIG